MKIRLAPRYQGRLTLADRLQLRVPTGWRALNPKELAAISADDGELAIIGIPRHLLKRWWSLVESDHIDTGFASYGREIADYFKYKNWGLPANALLEVVASGPARNRALVPSNPMRFGGGVGALFACINLDDQNAAIAIKPESVRIRVMLEPGEGLMMPSSGVLWNRSPVGNSDLAVTLLIGELAPQ